MNVLGFEGSSFTALEGRRESDIELLVVSESRVAAAGGSQDQIIADYGSCGEILSLFVHESNDANARKGERKGLTHLLQL
jgi:hypothetical protein